MSLKKILVGELEKALREAGCRLTPPRRAILAYLACHDSHPSARMIFESVRRSHPGLSRATVYNTLGLLVRLKLIKVLEFEQDNRYEMNLTCHLNLICTGCGKIQDFPESLPFTPEKLLIEQGFQVVDHRLEFYGLCAACRASGLSPPGRSHPPERTIPG